jgi:hypothetical protein
MVFVDTEAHIVQVEEGVERHTLRMGYALYIERFRGRRKKDTRAGLSFRTIKDFWGFVDQHALKGRMLYLFAHNWNYDAGILALSTWIREGGWNVIHYVNERPPLIIKLRKYLTRTVMVEEVPEGTPKSMLLHTPEGVKRVTKATLKALDADGDLEHYHVRVLDSLNFFGQALAALGKVLGLEKGEVKDFRTATDEELAPYNKRDTEILAEMMLRYFAFIEEHEMGNFAPTLAGQAFNAYRHGYMDDEIFIHDNEAVCSLERDAYHGGRTECFYIGTVEGSLHYLDVNSLYPSVMDSGLYPKRLIDHGEGGMPLEDLASLLEEGHGLIVDCLVDTPEPCFAKVDPAQRLIFPVGSFWTALTTPELRYALEQGYIRQVGRWAIYEMGPIYQGYVRAFYQMRLDFRSEGNEVYAYITKGLLNSLYGKTGQKGVVYESIGESKEQDDGLWVHIDEHGVRHQRRVRLGQVQELVQEQETRDSFPAIAAHVTGEARMKMWGYFKRAGLDHVYYTDTDSLIVDAEGYERLRSEVDPSILGMLKEEEQATSAIFRGPKDYTFGEHTEHIKGVSKRAVKLQHNLYEQDTFLSWDRIAARGEDGYIEVRRTRKVLERVYRKGVVERTGRVSPIRFVNNFSHGHQPLRTLSQVDEALREAESQPQGPEREDRLTTLEALRGLLLASGLPRTQMKALEGLSAHHKGLLAQLDSLQMLRSLRGLGIKLPTLEEVRGVKRRVREVEARIREIESTWEEPHG